MARTIASDWHSALATRAGDAMDLRPARALLDDHEPLLDGLFDRGLGYLARVSAIHNLGLYGSAAHAFPARLSVLGEDVDDGHRR
jgi:hypothetical protein